MSVNMRSKSQSRELPEQELTAELPSINSDRGSGRLFYVFSAVIHIVAAVALSGAWMVGAVATNKSANAAPPPPEKSPVARMAIDVGPIKFCEMNIETLVGRPQSQPGPR